VVVVRGRGIRAVERGRGGGLPQRYFFFDGLRTGGTDIKKKYRSTKKHRKKKTGYVLAGPPSKKKYRSTTKIS
jgi:hypothetical protein